MPEGNVVLTRDEVSQILKALTGIGNLVMRFTPRSGNQTEVYAVTSNIDAIRAILGGVRKISSN